MTKSTTGEQVTAAISTVAAIAILGVAVSAQQSRTTAADQLAQMESEVRHQFRLAFRHDASAHDARIAQLEDVLAAWRQAPQTAADGQLLTDWLREAMVRSKPGSTQELLPSPKFGESASPPQEVAKEVEPPADAAPTTLDEESDQDVSTPATDILDVPTTAPDAETIDYDALPAPSLAEPAATGTESAEAAQGPTPDVEFTTTRGMEPTSDFFAKPAIHENVPAVPAEPVAVNLSEFSARVSAYHRGLREIAAATDVGDAQLQRLTETVATLERLVAQHDFLILYDAALTPAERRLVTTPKSWAPQADALRRALDNSAGDTNGDFLQPFDSQRSNDVATLLERLDALVR